MTEMTRGLLFSQLMRHRKEYHICPATNSTTLMSPSTLSTVTLISIVVRTRQRQTIMKNALLLEHISSATVTSARMVWRRCHFKRSRKSLWMSLAIASLPREWLAWAVQWNVKKSGIAQRTLFFQLQRMASMSKCHTSKANATRQR